MVNPAAPNLTNATNVKHCCKVEGNLIFTGFRGEVEVWQCVICSSNHYQAIADKGILGIVGANLGEQVEVFEPLMIAQARCKCSEGNKPFYIRGIDVACVCEKCNNIYIISEISYSAKTKEFSLNVVCVGKHNG